MYCDACNGNFYNCFISTQKCKINITTLYTTTVSLYLIYVSTFICNNQEVIQLCLANFTAPWYRYICRNMQEYILHKQLWYIRFNIICALVAWNKTKTKTDYVLFIFLHVPCVFIIVLFQTRNAKLILQPHIPQLDWSCEKWRCIS
jgi:uncharacterized membrane protein